MVTSFGGIDPSELMFWDTNPKEEFQNGCFHCAFKRARNSFFQLTTSVKKAEKAIDLAQNYADMIDSLVIEGQLFDAIAYSLQFDENNALAITYCYYTLIDYLYTDNRTTEMQQYIAQYKEDLLAITSDVTPLREKNLRNFGIKILSFETNHPKSVYSSPTI